MTLYTVCINGQAAVVLSVDNAPVPEDWMLRSPETLNAIRETNAHLDKMNSIPGVKTAVELREVEEALDTWLGDDLTAATIGGLPIWHGDRSQLQIRPASPDEKEQWKQSADRAELGGFFQDDTPWVAFLVDIDD